MKDPACPMGRVTAEQLRVGDRIMEYDPATDRMAPRLTVTAIKADHSYVDLTLDDVSGLLGSAVYRRKDRVSVAI